MNLLVVGHATFSSYEFAASTYLLHHRIVQNNCRTPGLSISW
jgi:hypothetical protein